MLVFCVFRFTYFNISKPNDNDTFYVIEKYQNYVILEAEGIKYLYYDDTLNIGNRVLINGKIRSLENTDFNKYLKTQKVNYVIEGEIANNDNHEILSVRIINHLLDGKDKFNKGILKLILFNQKGDDNKEIYKYFEIFSIGYLIAISGFHVNILFKSLKNRKYSKYIIVLFYLYLLNFGISSYKAFLYYVLKKLRNKFKMPFNNSDLLSFIMISFLFLNPSYVFNKGFVYSFGFSFLLDLTNNIIANKNIKSNILKKILIYLFSIPLILNNYYELNLNSFIVSILFSYPISFLFIFSFIYLFFDKFYLIYKMYVYLLKLLLDFFYKYSYTFIFGMPGYIIMILLYGLLLAFLYLYQNREYIKAKFSLIIYFVILGVQYNLPNLNNKEIVYFLDIGQGDCTVLKLPNSKSVVLIDAGGSKYRDIANSKIIPFLKSKGIKEIDKIIISHDDIDHSGSRAGLIENFKVNEIIENSLIEEIYIGSNKFVNLNINENRDNDGSIVLYGEYGGLNYLFTGDISNKIEERIIKENNNIKVDVLKVSHHGSKSSTSEQFLSCIKAKIALIGVGKNNFYNHPDVDILNRLEKFKYLVYRTDNNGDIIIYKSSISNRIIIEKEKDVL